MSWIKIESAPSVPGRGSYRRPSVHGYAGHGTAQATTALDVWKCGGCGARACGPAGQDPGACLKAGCPTTARSPVRPARR